MPSLQQPSSSPRCHQVCSTWRKGGMYRLGGRHATASSFSFWRIRVSNHGAAQGAAR